MNTIVLNYEELNQWVKSKRKIMLVCGASARSIKAISELISYYGSRFVLFTDFSPNPSFESIVKAVRLFKEAGCDSIFAVGGGSAIDVAKCIKYFYCSSDDDYYGTWLSTHFNVVDIPFVAMPTTAGSGSEATTFAVFYYNGLKYSRSDEKLLPNMVFFDSSVLSTLPLYQKKATMCDALCHAIESYWSIHSTEQSKAYSMETINLIVNNADGYLSGKEKYNDCIMRAANLAGKAINISKTTAGHAMCYKITSLFGCAHGHAALMCNRALFPWMKQNIDKCVDPRGTEYLSKTFDELERVLQFKGDIFSGNTLEYFFHYLEFDVPTVSPDQYKELIDGVNVERLANNPIRLDVKSINYLYHEIFRR